MKWHIVVSMAHEHKLISFEGNIAAGKSTILSILNSLEEVEVAPEPITQWQCVPRAPDDPVADASGETMDILDCFYKEPRRWAMTFQMYAFASRLRHQQQRPARPDTRYLFMERSMESDKRIFAKNCRAQGLMSAVEYSIYCDLHAHWTANVRPLDAIVYLSTPPETCFERLLSRHREEELGVDRSYLEALHERHQEWLLGETDAPVFVIDNSRPLDDARRAEIAQQLVEFLDKL